MSMFHPYIEDSDLDKKIRQYAEDKTKTLNPLSKIISDCPKDAVEDMYKWIMIRAKSYEDYNFGNFQIKSQIIIQKFYELHPTFPNKTYEFGDFKVKKYTPEKPLKELIKELEEKNITKKSALKDEIEEINRVAAEVRFNDIKTVLLAIVIIFIIVGIIMQYVKESNCESVTYYEYGEKKTGQVCDDSAKYQLRNNIDETNKRKNN